MADASGAAAGGRLCALLLLVLSTGHVDAHLSAVCSSISETIPDRIVLWLISSDHNNEAALPGGASLLDPAGTLRYYQFADVCKLSSSQQLYGSSASTVDFQNALVSHCSGSYRGIDLVDGNSKLTCYYENSVPLVQGENWALGVGDGQDTSFYRSWDYSSWYASHFYPVPVDYTISGHYRLVTWGSDDRVDPCDYHTDTPCALGAALSRRRRCGTPFVNQTWWVELGRPDGGGGCVSPPPAALTAGTDYGPAHQTYCANVPDGFICPVACNSGTRQVGHLECMSGTWSPDFGCSPNPCEVPDAANNAGINGPNGYPNGIQLNRTCGVLSEHGAVCAFTCSGLGAWSIGRLVCNSGTWAKENSAADCLGPATDSVWPAPNVTALRDLGSGNLRIWWVVNDDGVLRSEIQKFSFLIVPSGGLTCPDYIGRTPPARGMLCYNGEVHAMFKYSIKVRVENLAGPGPWSAALRSACDPLSPSPEDLHRWDVSACAAVYGGENCTVPCKPGMTPDGPSSTNFTCRIDTGERTLRGTYPRCYKPAAAPVQVRLVGHSASSANIEWTDAGLNDVGGQFLPFLGWTVEVKPEAGGAWQVPAGCTALTSPCTTACRATGLASNSRYVTRVTAACVDPAFSSPASSLGSGMTLPQAAGAPVSLEVFARSASTLSIRWQPSSQQGDCAFLRWQVVLQQTSGALVSDPQGCQYLDQYDTPTCVLTVLPCDTSLEFTVRQLCTDTQANSPTGEGVTGTTTRDGSCLVPATPPDQLRLSATTPTEMLLRWSAGQPRDNTFQSWSVRMQRTVNDITGVWEEVDGCRSLTSRSVTQCRATGLRRGSYRFQVAESGVDARTSSPPSAPSDARELPPVPALPPTQITLAAPTLDGFQISWKAEDLRHCTFQRWEVTVYVVGQERSYRDPDGCVGLVSVCSTQCHATGLSSNTAYSVKVRAICEDTRANSPLSTERNEIRTLPQAAAGPVNVTATSLSDHSASISWVPAPASPNCQFVSWDVQVQEAGQTSWNDPVGCDGLTDESSTGCSATGLRCNTTHRVRVREVCTLGAATSQWTVSSPFTTFVGSVCLQAASPPENLQLVPRSASSIEVSFSSGRPGHCDFAGFEVQVRKVGDATWVTPQGNCALVTPRGGPLCTATGLEEDTAYDFRAREVCSNRPELASSWGVSENPARTARVPPLVARAQIPEGGVTESRPSALTLILGSNAQLDPSAVSAGASLTICPATDDPLPNSCGCTGSNCTSRCLQAETEDGSRLPRVYMISPQVLWYSFGSVLRVASFCNYDVTVARGFLRTEAQPPKSSPAFTWSFRYAPAPPQLQLTLSISTASSLELAATWSEPVTFTCSVVSQPAISATGVYTGPAPVRFHLTGLAPSTSYNVLCRGAPVNDPWNTVQETHGPLVTQDDTNVLLSDLQVTFQIMCNDTHTHGATVPATLTPALNASQAGGVYAVSLEVSSFRKECNIPITVDVVPSYEVALSATPQSPFATLVYAPPSATQMLGLEWYANTTPTNFSTVPLSVEVRPFTTGDELEEDRRQAAARYTVEVTLLFKNIVALAMRLSHIPLLLNGTSSVELDLSMEPGVDTSGLQVKLGSLRQTAEVASSQTATANGHQQLLVTLRVPGATGTGQNLPVTVVSSGIEYKTNYTVSFDIPPVLDGNGLPACPVPDASNNAGISGPNGHPNAIEVISTMPACKIPHSDSGAECLFRCSVPGAWGVGKIVCNSGNWIKQSASTDCKSEAEDSLWPAPVIHRLSDVGSGGLKVVFTRTEDGRERSAVLHYNFDVVPSGQLSCHDVPGELPPPGGAICTGGVASDMGRYEVRVRAVNRAGPGAWSAAAQRVCRPLVPPVSDAWRYDVSACASLLDGQSCRPSCRSGTVQVGASQDFVCNEPPAVPTGSYPTCVKPAEAPVGVVAVAGSSQTEVAISWNDAGLNDCGPLVPFVRWRVQMRRAPGGPWGEPAGCLRLFSPCSTSCTATGLASNTRYEAKVSVLCGQSEANSPESLVGSGSTLPSPADAPVDLRVVSSTATTMAISWRPGPQPRDCVFGRWEVQLRSPSGTWSSNPDGCQLLDRLADTSCTLLGLACDTTFSLRVRHLCQDEQANSPAGQPVTASTVKDGDCLRPAGTPTGLVGIALSPTSMHLSWTPGTPNDCIFQSYKVRVQRTDRFGQVGQWEEAEGCRSLPSRTYAQCTATGLRRGTYTFYVAEQCQDSQTSSAISSPSASVTLPLKPALAPTGVSLDGPGRSGFRASWSAPELNDCTFQRWLVEVRPAGGAWQPEPAGCRNLIDACVSHCEVAGADSHTAYEARVSVKCLEPTAEGPASTPSDRLTTLPVVSGAPPSVAARNLTATTAEIHWTPGAQSQDCLFLEWEVQLQVETYTDWRTPEGCDVASRTATSCIARGLRCGTTYRARVRELCSPPGASSPFTTSAAFSSLNSVRCTLVGSAGPVAIRMGLATTTSLQIYFSPGNGNDCVFASFDVQQQIEGEGSWDPAQGSCARMTRRDGPSCTATGLRDGTSYRFRVRERCSNGVALDSPWVISEDHAETVAVPPVMVMARRPEGELTSTRPGAITVIFKEDTKMTTPTPKRLRICPSTALPLPNPCGCTGQGCVARCVVPPVVATAGIQHVQLLSPEVLYYDFSSVLQVGSGCEYSVQLDEGLLETKLEPSKASPQIRWTFKYTPPPPQLLQVDLVRSTTTSITLSLAWSEPTQFTCRAPGTSAVSSTVAYTGVSAVEVTLGGLLPSSSYNVEFEGSALADPWNRAGEVRGVYRTQDDTDSRLSQLQVFVRRQCCSSCTPGQAAPALLRPEFDPARTGAVSHAVHIDYSAFRDECGVAATALAQPRYLVSVNATPRSAFASVAFDPSSRELELTVDWPAGVIPTGSVAKSFSVQVNPYTGGSTQASTFAVEANLLTTSINGQQLRQCRPGPLPPDGSVCLELNITTLVGVDTSNFGISLGPFTQTVRLNGTTNALVDGLQQTISTLRVETPVGVGRDLPVIVTTRSLDYELPLKVSFAPPTITRIYTLVNGLAAQPSLLRESIVRVQGTGLAPLGTGSPSGSSGGNSSSTTAAQIYIVGVPGGCVDAACQETTVQQLWNAGTTNLCGPTVAISNTELECTLQPSTQNPLGTAVMTRDGGSGRWSSAVLANPSNGSQAMTYEAPVMSGMSVRQQDLSSVQPFRLNGRSFPQEELTQGYMQLWATPNANAMAQGSANASGALTVDPSNADSGLQPLCSYTRRVSATEIQCQRSGDWQGRALSTEPLVFLQVGPRKLSADVLRGALLIPQMVVTSVNSSDPYEVGPKEIQINGANFGAPSNGPLEVVLHTQGSATVAVEDSSRHSMNTSLTTQVQCYVSERSSSIVRCLMNSSVFGAPLAASEYDFGVGADALSSLKNYPVMAEVRFAGADSTAMEAVALQATHDFTVQLLSCSAGQYRASPSSRGCVDCEPGRFKNDTGGALSCRPCPVGTFGAYPGLGSCQRCESSFTTRAAGVAFPSNCTCAPGFFKNLSDASRGPHGSGVCLPCPRGAHCDGSETQPYARSGYWTPDRLRFWSCWPAAACMRGSTSSPNRCESSRKPDGRRCAECESGHYRYKSECHACKPVDNVVAWLGPIAVLLLLWLVMLPWCVVHFRQKKHAVGTMVEAGPGGFVDQLFGGERPGILKRLTHPDHPSTRMITLAFNRMQLLWALGLIPYAWPIVLETQHTILGVFAFDVDVLRPACLTNPFDGFKSFIDLAYFNIWVISWAAPYFCALSITLGLFIVSRRHKDPHDPRWINFAGATFYVVSVIFLFAVMRHMVDDVTFLHCMPCEDDDSCLINYPLIKCGFDSDDEAWLTMSIMSIVDIILVVIPLGVLLLHSIYLSWSWQHGHGIGVDKHGHKPWYVFMSEFWVKDYRGYSAQFRRVAGDLRTLIRRKAHGDTDLRDVWLHCRFLIEEEEWKFHESLLNHVLRKLLQLTNLESSAALQKMSKKTETTASGAANPADLPSERSENSGDGVAGTLSGDSNGFRLPRAITNELESRRVQRVKEKWVGRLLYLITRTEEFVKKTGTNIRILTRGSLFFTYAWEYFLAVQKILIVCITLLTANADSTAIKTACLLFMLLLLVMSVDLRPYSWSFLNNLDLLMDVLTLYMVIFMQLDWPVWLTVVALTVSVVTVLPVLTRLVLPPYNGALDEEEREVVEAASSTIEEEMNVEASRFVGELLEQQEDAEPAGGAVAESTGAAAPRRATPQIAPLSGDAGTEVYASAGSARSRAVKPNLALAALRRMATAVPGMDAAPSLQQEGEASVAQGAEVHVTI